MLVAIRLDRFVSKSLDGGDFVCFDADTGKAQAEADARQRQRQGTGTDMRCHQNERTSLLLVSRRQLATGVRVSRRAILLSLALKHPGRPKEQSF